MRLNLSDEEVAWLADFKVKALLFGCSDMGVDVLVEDIMKVLSQRNKRADRDKINESLNKIYNE